MLMTSDKSRVIFLSEKLLKNIVLKSTVTILETFAFTGANKAESVTLPYTLTTIHWWGHFMAHIN